MMGLITEGSHTAEQQISFSTRNITVYLALEHRGYVIDVTRASYIMCTVLFTFFGHNAWGRDHQ